MTAAKSSAVDIAVPTRTTAYAWYLAGMLAAAYLVSVMDRYILGVVLEEVKQNLSLSDTQLGVLQGPSFVFLFLLASIPFGRLADLVSRRALITAGLAIWSAATAACGLSHTFTELMVSRLMVGLGEAALMPSAMSLIAAYFTRDKLSRGVAVYMSGASLGRAAAFAGGGALFTWFVARNGMSLPGFGQIEPWRAVFVTAAAIGLAFTVLFCLTCREPPRAPRPATGGRLKDGLRYFWSHRLAYVAVLMPFAMLSAIAVAMAAWSVSFYVRKHGMAVAQASALIGLTGLVVGPSASLFAGWLNDKLRTTGRANTQPLVLVICLTLALAFTAILTLASSVPLAAAAYGVTYFMVCMAGPTGLSGVQLLTPDAHRGTLSSVALIFYSGLSAIVAPPLVGVFADRLFSEGRLDLAMLASIATLVLVGIAIGLAGRKRFSRTVQTIEAHAAAVAPAA